MISLAIGALLLVAVGGAYSASSAAIEANDEFFRATQAARVSMNQLLAEIRRSDGIDVGTGYVDVIRPDEDALANEVYRRYGYDAAGQRLTLTIHFSDGTTSPTYTLASHVTSATFGPAEQAADSAGETVVARLPVRIGVTVGKNAITLTGAAGPRRALPN